MIELSVIVLTKNNLQDLLRTLCSIDLYCRGSKVIVFDGSDSTLENNSVISSFISSKTNVYTYYHKPNVRGVYLSMNSALSLVQTETLIFLNSGDVFTACPARSVRTLLDHSLYGVFAAANILNNGNVVYQYPFIGIKNINTWLNLWFQLPIHQAIVFKTSWALDNPYPAYLPVSADAVVKKKLISSGCFRFEPFCLVSFSLGGVSSSSLYLSSNEVFSLPLNKQFRLYIKFFLQNFLRGFPIVSIAKNKLINLYCTFF